MALSFLGDQRISSINDDSERARLCKTYYDQARKEILETIAWTFSRKRAALSTLSETPAFGWPYQAQLPGDYIRLIEVKSEGCDVNNFDVEDGKVLSDYESISIWYIFDQEDANKFSPSFVRAFARLLASHIAMGITGKVQLAEQMRAIYEQKELPDAQYYNQVQDRSNENNQTVKVVRSGALRNQRFKGNVGTS